jgi:hypothetical protein
LAVKPTTFDVGHPDISHLTSLETSNSTTGTPCALLNAGLRTDTEFPVEVRCPSSKIRNNLVDRKDRIMAVLENIVVDLAVLAISGLSALGLGHLFLSVVVKDRRSS